LQRRSLAREFLQGVAISRDSFEEVGCVAFVLAKCSKRFAEVILGRSPQKRDAFACPYRKYLAKGGKCFGDSGAIVVAPTQSSKRVAKIVLSRGPVVWNAVAGAFF
jgi:hypothetical protein